MKQCQPNFNVYQLLRQFRHDLLNDLQLLMGHLQLGRDYDTIRQDVEKVIETIQNVSHIYACGDDELATLIWSWQMAAREQGIDFSYHMTPLSEACADDTLTSLNRLVGLLLNDLSPLQEDRCFLYLYIDDTPHLILQFSPIPIDSPTLSYVRQLGWRVAESKAERMDIACLLTK